MKSNKMNKKTVTTCCRRVSSIGQRHERASPMAFYTSFRMTPEIFDKVLLKIEHKLQTCDLYRKDTISPAERLAVTLR